MRTIKFIVVTFLIIVCTCPAMAQSGSKKLKKKTKAKVTLMSFKNDIFPVLKMNCLPCHSEAQMNPSELYLDSYDQLMTGGKHGRPVVPGKADSSIIMKKLSSKPPFGDPMPMKAKIPMTDSSINIIKNWVNQGAKNN